jgi:hypothetical protein
MSLGLLKPCVRVALDTLQQGMREQDVFIPKMQQSLRILKHETPKSEWVHAKTILFGIRERMPGPLPQPLRKQWLDVEMRGPDWGPTLADDLS